MYQTSKALIITFLVLAAFISCATPQPSPKVSTAAKGYSEIWLDRKNIQIDFKGKNDEQVDTLKNLAILRAAELGRELAFRRFVILRTTDQTIIDGVIRSGSELLPVEKLKVSVTVKFVDKNDPEYSQAFDIEAKIADIKKGK